LLLTSAPLTIPRRACTATRCRAGGCSSRGELLVC
jgi:hypothetical protein